jgi:Zn-dependent protease with chaperone function
MSHPFLYPASPANVPASVTDPSPAFKKEVKGVMGSIILFFIVYLLMFFLSIALVVACFYGGIAIITNLPKLITIVAGIGLIGVGVMVFIFLIKFLFAVSKYDRSGIIEITEQEQPRLFGFIRKLTEETQTQFPKKIYVSPDVNACVFYDSSFWSMFFPVKKNLQIGLGLVNSLNISEFKGVMAHEFGHFSQRSMKLGSFVYNVNKIIHNMLFENKSYGEFLQSWANVDGIFALFASITAGIAQAIQSILREMYGFINKKYMSLSREMEFHADAVAASVSGSNSLSSALRRIEIGGSGYDITLQKCDDFFKQKKISANIYPHQTAVLLQLATTHKLPLQNGLPLVSEEFMNSTNFSRVNFKDQWASHPATEDRVKHLNDLAVPAEELHESAWVLFDNKEKLQEQLTQKIYEHIEKPQDIVAITDNDFNTKLETDIKQGTLPEEYKGFYNNRQIAIIEDFVIVPSNEAISFDAIFTEENALLNKKIIAAESDIEILKAIAEKKINTKTFDFDGIKHNRKDVAAVQLKMESELKVMQEQLANLDKQAVHFFYNKAMQKGADKAEELKQQYEHCYGLRRKAEEFLKQANEMLVSMQEIFSGQTIQIPTINVIIGNLKEKHEPLFKSNLQEWRQEGAFIADSDLRERIDKFIEANYVYFDGASFMNTELSSLHEISRESWAAIHDFVFDTFKVILEKQLAYK